MEEKDEIQIENYIDDTEQLNLEIQDENRKIIWQAKDFSIREFLAMEQEGDLILQPDYQRKYVMDATKASRLIESILMDVPIPVVYLAEEQDGTYSVIDGQQRLTSFISFMKGNFPDNSEFKLKGLKVLTELNKSTYAELEKVMQIKVKTTTIHTVIIKKESEEDIKFEIFERLNTGAIKLNQDELRNSVYRGSYIKLLANLENNDTLHSLIRKDNFKKRMIYRGMLLRFFAFSEKTYLNYKPSMKQFLNKELRDNQNLSQNKAKEYTDKVNHCLDLVRTVFGTEAFRKFTIDDSDVNGKWSNSINMALFEVQMCGFLRYSKNQIVPHSDRIREAMIELLLTDKFNKSISTRTNDRDQVETRFKMWFEKFEALIGTPNVEPRVFSHEIKRQLFENDTACKICNQNIQMIDDAEVDHIMPYSKGGLTTIENAQITHRYCNRVKSNNE